LNSQLQFWGRLDPALPAPWDGWTENQAALRETLVRRAAARRTTFARGRADAAVLRPRPAAAIAGRVRAVAGLLTRWLTAPPIRALFAGAAIVEVAFRVREAARGLEALRLMRAVVRAAAFLRRTLARGRRDLDTGANGKMLDSVSS
jgi:hypothetical protein